VSHASEFRFAAEIGRPPTGAKKMADEKKLRIGVVAAAGAVLLLLGISFTWLRQAPQIGEDKEAYLLVEGLFTALSSQSEERLAKSEERMHALRDQGKLPGPVADYLDGLITDARAGKWKAATKQMFAFMKAQRPPDALRRHG
jgi:hypothetical protein